MEHRQKAGEIPLLFFAYAWPTISRTHCPSAILSYYKTFIKDLLNSTIVNFGKSLVKLWVNFGKSLTQGNQGVKVEGFWGVFRGVFSSFER